MGKTKKSEAEVSETPAEDAGIKSGEPVDRAALDGHDAGVPMLGGDPSEPQGPEDALGEGDKRGDYSGRQDGATHLESREIEGGGEPIRDKDGTIVDFTPKSELVEQNPRVDQIGDVAGEKGGVTTTAS